MPKNRSAFLKSLVSDLSQQSAASAANILQCGVSNSTGVDIITILGEGRFTLILRWSMGYGFPRSGVGDRFL